MRCERQPTTKKHPSPNVSSVEVQELTLGVTRVTCLPGDSTGIFAQGLLSWFWFLWKTEEGTYSSLFTVWCRFTFSDVLVALGAAWPHSLCTFHSSQTIPDCSKGDPQRWGLLQSNPLWLQITGTAQTGPLSPSPGSMPWGYGCSPENPPTEPKYLRLSKSCQTSSSTSQYGFLFLNWKIIALQCYDFSAIQQLESAISIYLYPLRLEPPFTSHFPSL